MLFFNCIQTALFSAVAVFSAPETSVEDIEAAAPETEDIGERGVTAKCSASKSGGGRQNAEVTVSGQDPNICIRTKLGGTAPPGLDNCWKVAAALGCSQVVDAN